MKIFKFGGASVKDAAAVRNVVKIINAHEGEDIWIVVSAMGKSTNHLEKILSAYWQEDGEKEVHFKRFKAFHRDIINELFPFSEQDILREVNLRFKELKTELESLDRSDYDKSYDAIVSVGEWLSTKIVSAHLAQAGVNNEWLDAKSLIATSDTHREGEVDWELSRKQIVKAWENEQQSHSVMGARCMVTQGFVGACSGVPTTLGREGSDYSAAIIAWCLDAKEVTIWKDVPGVLNADPKYYPEAERLHNISYREAIELSYYGASVIHPKTIKPLQNKKIPMHVRSFVDIDAPGTVISTDLSKDGLMPCYIFKSNQVLISISPVDFSFIMEEGMSNIFKKMRSLRLRANLLQNSALSFSVCLDDKGKRIDELISLLGTEYRVLHNRGVSLLTIRHYDDATMNRVLDGREVLVEQRSRQTARFVVKGEFERTA